MSFFSPRKTELITLLNWSLRRSLKAIFSIQVAPLIVVANTIRMFFKARNYSELKDIKFVCIEPNVAVCEPKLRLFSQKFDVSYFPIAILGHDQHYDFEILDLNCYENTLSSSIYNKQSSIGSKKLACIAFKFSVFFDLLKKHIDITPDDEVILRINCEGAELGIVKAIRESGLMIRSIYGSLADVKKIHGENEYKEMLEILSELGISYHYFVGSNPATWLETFSSPTIAKLIYK